MGAIISLGDRWIKISNGACSKAFDDAIFVGESQATTEIEKEYLLRLKYERMGFYSGYCPDLEGLFPTLEERKFWARCFLDAGRWLYEGRLENPPGGGASPAIWIFHTYWFAELLRELIRRDDRNWPIDDLDTVLRAEQRDRELDEYRIKHEAVMANRLAEQNTAEQSATRPESK
jgi:hypothetical protein